jgi:hypothetical protein
VLYTIYFTKYKPYNNLRTNIYHTAGCIGVIWVAITTLAFSDAIPIWIISTFVGIALLVVGTAVIALKTKSYLLSVRDREIAPFFRFSLDPRGKYILADDLKSVQSNVSIILGISARNFNNLASIDDFDLSIGSDGPSNRVVPSINEIQSKVME